jgi:hypothetical protein
MHHNWGTEHVKMNHNYSTAAGETLKITAWKYYVSNVYLIDSEGREVKLPDTYFLQGILGHGGGGHGHKTNSGDHDDAHSEFELQNIPAGTYTQIKFLVGVDSTRNVSGAQTGALDPANGMFWSWTTGYIFHLLEGKVVSSGDSTFKHHVGGFRQAANNNRWVTLALPAALNLAAGGQGRLDLKVDLQKYFNNPSNNVRMSGNLVAMAPQATASLGLANNYAQMFGVLSAQ